MSKFWQTLKRWLTFKKSTAGLKADNFRGQVGMVAYYVSRGKLFFMLRQSAKQPLSLYHRLSWLVTDQHPVDQAVQTALNNLDLNVACKAMPGVYPVLPPTDDQQMTSPSLAGQFILVKLMHDVALNQPQTGNLVWLSYQQAHRSLKSPVELEILTTAYKIIKRAQI